MPDTLAAMSGAGPTDALVPRSGLELAGLRGWKIPARAANDGSGA